MQANGAARLEDRHKLTIIGQGTETLLLVHGFGSDQRAWRRVLPALLPGRRIILFDNAGAGTAPEDHFDFAHYSGLHAYADDVVEVLTTIGVRGCVGIGHSVGGMLCALAAIRRPDLFRKLVLIGASPRYIDDNGYRGGFARADVDRLIDAMTANYAAWVGGFAPLAIGGPPGDPAVEEFSRRLLALRPDVAISLLMCIFHSDLRHVLPNVPVPCALLQTRKDAAVPLAVAEYLRDHLPRATLDIIDAEGHLPHLTAPHAVRDALLRHLG